MTVPKVKSCAQLRSQAKSRRTSKKHHVEQPKAKQTSSDAQSSTKAPKGRHRCSKRYLHQMNPLTGSVHTFSAESNDPIYDDDSNPVDDNGSSFAKRHVLTTDDQESAGAFKSGLRTVLIPDRAPVTTDSSEAADSARMSTITRRAVPARANIEMNQKMIVPLLSHAVPARQGISQTRMTSRPPLF